MVKVHDWGPGHLPTLLTQLRVLSGHEVPAGVVVSQHGPDAFGRRLGLGARAFVDAELLGKWSGLNSILFYTQPGL